MSRYCPSGLVCLIGLLAWVSVGCTLSPKVSVSEGAAKSAASELGTGMEGAAKTLGTELVHASKPYEEELLARVNDLTLTAKELIRAAEEMPKAFGEAVTDRLAREKSFQNALRGFSVLAQSPEHLASAVEKGPSVLSGKLEELKAELSREDGFLTKHAIDQVFSQATLLVRDSLWLLLAIVVVLWGLPFAAGFIVGRILGRKGR